MKVVINRCHGGFRISAQARQKLVEWGMSDDDLEWNVRMGDRAHPLLVRVVEELCEAASDNYSRLRVVEIPDGVEYVIEDYDGFEHIAERHRTWPADGE